MNSSPSESRPYHSMHGGGPHSFPHPMAGMGGGGHGGGGHPLQHNPNGPPPWMQPHPPMGQGPHPPGHPGPHHMGKDNPGRGENWGGGGVRMWRRKGFFWGVVFRVKGVFGNPTTKGKGLIPLT